MPGLAPAFTPVFPSASEKQLLITLAQPVYGIDGGALGVFAVDVHLKRLSEMLQERISAHGTVFLVDGLYERAGGVYAVVAAPGQFVR